MASFDTTSKKQVETNPEDFVYLCFKFGLENITVLEVVTPEQPTIEMHQADVLIKALYDGKEVLVHFEFQTTDSYDPEMPLRMAGYIIRAIEVYRLPIYSNVLYLRPDAGENDPGKFTQNLENHNISIEYQVFRLIEIDGQEILDLKAAGLIPFTPLMKRPTDLDSEQWLRRCVQIADSIDVPNKPEYLGSLAVLGNLVYDSQTILDIISEETMQHPPIVEYVAPQARERGRKENTRENILELLTFRLQAEVEQTFRPALEAIDDLQRLKQLFQAAMRVETPEEFTQALNENTE
ncbi:hypothetical protein C6501_18695 [Candidatus Poribacteria bacterium]|nr:MAG: hypothetical protein C6501_18695 [Candidatus Poribacteria bacterium]